MDSSVPPEDEMWFLRVCHHISTSLYHSVKIYSNWLQEQFCNLFLYALYIVCAINIFVKKIASMRVQSLFVGNELDEALVEITEYRTGQRQLEERLVDLGRKKRMLNSPIRQAT